MPLSYRFWSQYLARVAHPFHHFDFLNRCLPLPAFLCARHETGYWLEWFFYLCWFHCCNAPLSCQGKKKSLSHLKLSFFFNVLAALIFPTDWLHYQWRFCPLWNCSQRYFFCGYRPITWDSLYQTNTLGLQPLLNSRTTGYYPPSRSFSPTGKVANKKIARV